MEKPYFPPLSGAVECHKCEKGSGCWCRGKYQRNRRDFTHTSGRCPRLPDRRGFVEKEERALYAATFPLVHAELGCELLHLTLTIPGQRRAKKVYRTKSGYWYFKQKNGHGYISRRVLEIGGYYDESDIQNYMERMGAAYCILRCNITDYTV